MLFRSVISDIEKLEGNIKSTSTAFESIQSELSTAKMRETELKRISDDMHQLMIISQRFRDDGIKISEKMIEIATKKSHLSRFVHKAAGRDIRSLENEIAAKQEKRESLSMTITALNNEAKDLTDGTRLLNLQITEAEEIGRAHV